MQLFDCLGIPAVCGPFSNRGTCEGQKLFLFLLRRAASDLRYCDLKKEFGGDETMWGRGVKWLLDFIHIQHGYRLYALSSQWVDKFGDFAAGIRDDANAKARADYGHDAFLQDFNVAMFIDCTQIRTCSLLTGPSQYGPNQPRRDPTRQAQEAIYNGWKSVHGGKIQTIDAPNGMTILASPMCSVRHNDTWLLNVDGHRQKGSGCADRERKPIYHLRRQHLLRGYPSSAPP